MNPLPEIAFQFSLVVLLCATVYAAGALFLGGLRMVGTPWRYPVLCFASGLMVVTGGVACLALGRPTFLLAAPAMFLVFALWAALRRPAPVPLPVRWKFPQDLLASLVACALSVLFCRFWFGGLPAAGMINLPFKDWGYFAMLVENLVPSGYMSIWSGVAGDELGRTGAARDMWYHWGFIWLAVFVKQMTGLGALAALTGVAVPATVAMAGISASCIVSQLTGWTFLRSFAPALLCLFFVALGPSTLLQPFLVSTFGLVGVLFCNGPFVTIPWLAFESVYLFAVIWAWLRGTKRLCWLFILTASISAPHSFLVLGSTLGMFAAISVLRRNWHELKLALLGVVAVVLGYVFVNWIGGAGMARTGGGSGVALAIGPVWGAAKAVASDVGLTFLFLGLLLPGFLHLIVGRKIEIEGRVTTLGWIVLSALISGVAGFRLLEFLGLGSIDAIHLPGVSRVLLVLPLCAFGTVRLFAKGRPAAAGLAAVTFLAAMALALHDLPQKNGKVLSELPALSERDATLMARHLNGSRFGYFALTDRNWWIPIQSSLAAVLGSSCVRLNPLPETDNDWAGKQYGSELPFQIVPRDEGESDALWACRFAERMGIRYVMESEIHPIPASVKDRFALVARGDAYSLFIDRKYLQAVSNGGSAIP